MRKCFQVAQAIVRFRANKWTWVSQVSLGENIEMWVGSRSALKAMLPLCPINLVSKARSRQGHLEMSPNDAKAGTDVVKRPRLLVKRNCRY